MDRSVVAKELVKMAKSLLAMKPEAWEGQMLSSLARRDMRERTDETLAKVKAKRMEVDAVIAALEDGKLLSDSVGDIGGPGSHNAKYVERLLNGSVESLKRARTLLFDLEDFYDY